MNRLDHKYLIKNLRLGYIDLWKYYSNEDSDRYTWYHHIGTGFRLDYAFLSNELEKQIKIMDVSHDSKSREDGMTDHSPLIMEYSLGSVIHDYQTKRYVSVAI